MLPDDLTISIAPPIRFYIQTCRPVPKYTVGFLIYFYLQIRLLNHYAAIGEVWANMLFNVYANLVDLHGFSANARTDPTTSEGNVIFLHLFIDSLAIQPCNPTCKRSTEILFGEKLMFSVLNARDAWLQADVNRFGGANACALWDAFASRGLGVGAANHTDSFLLPPGCPSS